MDLSKVTRQRVEGVPLADTVDDSKSEDCLAKCSGERLRIPAVHLETWDIELSIDSDKFCVRRVLPLGGQLV